MDMIEWIVMTILDLPYKDVHGKCIVLDSEITRSSKNDRKKRVDLIIKFGIHEIILEMNNNFVGSIVRNIVYGMTRIVTFYQKYRKKMRKLNKRVDYYHDKIRVSVINLNWNSKKRKSKIDKTRVEKVYGFDDERRGIFFEIVNVTLDKYANMPYNEVNKKEKFYKLLTIDNKNDLLKFTKNESLLEGYVHKLIEYSKDEKYKEGIMTEAMDRYLRESEFFNAGEEYGLERGIERGGEQKERDVVLAMNNDKAPYSLISKYTKLSISKIKEIINANNN